MSRRFAETTVENSKEKRKVSNVSLMSFAQKIYGKCPNCRHATIIKADLQYYNSLKNARVQCLNCAFYENWNSEKIYGKAVGKAQRPCPNCGTKWLTVEIEIENAKPFKDHAEVICKMCLKSIRLSLSWQQKHNNNKPLNPYFNSSLWLQIECAGEILWAFNEDHLEYLKSYIEADLREDDARKNWSMISRLPKWMTSAKNRKDVLKAITKLEKNGFRIK